jgi:RHS repeat-associated protein
LTNRYLWGAEVDQLLTDEQFTPTTPGELPAAQGTLVWALGDHLNTVRDLAIYESATGVTMVVNHVVYDSFGNVISETAPAFGHLFGFTARPFDPATALQNNFNRWYEAYVGWWLSPDPSGFDGQDTNLYRYVGNGPVDAVDPLGLYEAYTCMVFVGSDTFIDLKATNFAKTNDGENYATARVAGIRSVPILDAGQNKPLDEINEHLRTGLDTKSRHFPVPTPTAPYYLPVLPLNVYPPSDFAQHPTIQSQLWAEQKGDTTNSRIYRRPDILDHVSNTDPSPRDAWPPLLWREDAEDQPGNVRRKYQLVLKSFVSAVIKQMASLAVDDAVQKHKNYPTIVDSFDKEYRAAKGKLWTKYGRRPGTPPQSERNAESAQTLWDRLVRNPSVSAARTAARALAAEERLQDFRASFLTLAHLPITVSFDIYFVFENADSAVLTRDRFIQDVWGETLLTTLKKDQWAHFITLDIRTPSVGPWGPLYYSREKRKEPIHLNWGSIIKWSTPDDDTLHIRVEFSYPATVPAIERPGWVDELAGGLKNLPPLTKAPR